MAILTLTFNPDKALDVSPKFAVKKVKFGDGYEHRAPDGVNSVAEEWQVTYSDELDAPDAVCKPTQAYDFLVARKGVEPFWWTPPGASEPKKFVCENPQKTFPFGANYAPFLAVVVVSGTFREVFDL